MDKAYTRFEHYNGDRAYQDETLVDLALVKPDFGQTSSQGKGFCNVLDKTYTF